MPKIQWDSLPEGRKRHILERAKQREIDMRALALLQQWRESDPDVPDGRWYKGFGGFWLCGEGSILKTILSPEQSPLGEKIP